jgi:hypothetical protein
VANNYTLFSLLVPLTKRSRAWHEAVEMLQAGKTRRDVLCGEDDYDGADANGFDFEADTDIDGELVLFSEENGDPVHVARFLQALMARKLCKPMVAMTWAETCSVARPDEFGGGGMVVTPKEVYWFGVREMLARKMGALRKKAKKARRGP